MFQSEGESLELASKNDPRLQYLYFGLVIYHHWGLSKTKITINRFFAIFTFYIVTSLVDIDNIQMLGRYEDGWVGRWVNR